MPRRTPQVEYRTLSVSGAELPVKVIRERRSSVRAYMGKQELIVRLPSSLPAEAEAQHWQRLHRWLAQQEKNRPGTLDRYEPRTYQDGDRLQVGERTYRILIQLADKQTHSGRLETGVIELSLSKRAAPADRQTAIRTLLSRLVAQDFLPAITRRVRELNALHFNRPVKAVRLKHNHSNWGSCSNSGNINLSTRLLFAPPIVIDYVIIHELAHLVELNHSDRFWALVARAMPDYETHEAWLKVNGAACNY